MKTFAQSIVETVRHPLLILDEGLRVRRVNPAFHTVFGIPAGQAEGRLLNDLGGAAWAAPRVFDLLTRVVHGEAFDGFAVEAYFLGLGRREFLLNARRVYAEDDPAPMILLAIEDVTEARQARDALRRVNDELERRVHERTAQLEAASQEMEAFCYSVSHDLRAPLRAIDGFARELLDAYADRLDDQGRHYLGRMRANSQRMAQLIDDLLLLSRLGRAEMTVEPVDLSALARDVAADLRQREPGRQVDLTIQPGLTAKGDPRLLRVVLDNLLGNAWKFAGKKPHATVEVGRADTAGGPAFFVRDDGAGFDPQYAGKLFGAFQRLHHERDFPGTGIGLAIVRRVVHRHGGRVWAEGAVGAGATFCFTLAGG